MQKFFDTGAKFHEFPLRCGIAEESLIYDNLLNNKSITKQHICYMHIFWKNTHFKLVQNEWRFYQIRLSACLALIVERIGWKPSSHAPYKNPALETSSPSMLQHLCFWECKARISRCIVIFACTIYVPWFVGGWRGIFHFFFSRLLQPETLKSWPWKLLPWILIFLVNRIICNFARII